MKLKNLVIIISFVAVSLNYLKNVEAQDTFGPVCDDVTVTCAPTMSPTPGGPSETPTLTPTVTQTPTPPPPTPTELPRAGYTDNLRNIIFVSVLLIFAGSTAQLVLASKKS